LAGVVAATAPASRSASEDDTPPARSAREVRGATPYAPIENEPAPKLIVDDPLPDLLHKGIVWIQYRTENLRIVPVFGKGALSVSPRVGHLHVRVDDLPWLWADASDTNTIDIAGMPPGEHKVHIELVDANHQVFPGQSKTVKFTVPGTASVGVGGKAQHAQHIGKSQVKVTQLSQRDIIEKLDGRDASATVKEVTFEPGQKDLPHRHAGPVFGYVLEGEYEHAINDEPVKTYKAGETFYEPSGSVHRVAQNPSGKTKTRLLAVILHPRGDKEVTVPEKGK
jgi:quercetin dioxygenase-like cupin family protein